MRYLYYFIAVFTLISFSLSGVVNIALASSVTSQNVGAPWADLGKGIDNGFNEMLKGIRGVFRIG